jgi:alkyldihydroxyacetonephosphate synthase
MHSSSVPLKVVKQLQKICGETGVSLRETHRIAYSRDCSTTSLIDIRAGRVRYPPDVIVWPQGTEQVSQVLKIADRHRIPVVPYGAGSGVCGAAVPLKGGIVLDLKKMDRVLSLDQEALTVTAQTGILGEILERRLKSAGFTLGHFPSSIYTATLGGFLACRSAGQLSTKYGKIEDMVRGFTVCLADGRILKVGEHEKADLRELFVGSEGTLGVITEATLAVHPQPEIQAYRAFRFPTLSQGLKAIRRFMQAGFRPAVVRLYDPLDSLLFFLSGEKGDAPKGWDRFLKRFPVPVKFRIGEWRARSLQTVLSQARLLNRLVEWSLSRVLLILGFEGPLWKVDEELRGVMSLCEEEGGRNLGEGPGLHWLRKRYSMGYKMSPLVDQGCFADTMEVAVPWSRLDELYEGIRSAFRKEALVMAHFSHAYSDGCSIYFTFAGYAPTADESLDRHHRLWTQALEACLESGGTISHHHGVGFLKAEAFVREAGPLHGWLKKTKKVLDPNGILNPGKLGL